jgi:hypothetical protein
VRAAARSGHPAHDEGSAPPRRRRRLWAAEWAEAAAEWAAGVYRADAAATAAEIAAQLATFASWHSATTRPTWALLCKRTGRGRSTIGRHLKAMRAAGLLVVIETGSTPAIRSAVLHDAAEGNRAAVYFLALPDEPVVVDDRAELAAAPADLTWAAADPAVDRSETPTGSRREISPRARDVPTGGHKHDHEQPRKTRRGPDGPLEKRTGEAGPPSRAADRRRRVDAATVLRRGSLPLRRLSAAYVASIAAPFLASGPGDPSWTVADLLWALDHTPDGRPWTYTSDVGNPAGWARHRLAAWRDDAGRIRPGRRAQLLLAAAADRARIDADRAALGPVITPAEAREAARQWAPLARQALRRKGDT